jgi:hypothetical protein
MSQRGLLHGLINPKEFLRFFYLLPQVNKKILLYFPEKTLFFSGPLGACHN